MTLLLGCATGAGEGSVSGPVWAPACGLEGEVFDLRPNFFAMDASESVDIVDIRIQRGSDTDSRSDGMTIAIDGAESFQRDLVGVDLDLSLFSQVQLSLHLNRTCPSLTDPGVVYRAVSGTIRFDRLYLPWLDGAETTETIGVFDNVELVDTSDREERRALMSGSFRFLYSTGQPVQPFSP